MSRFAIPGVVDLAGPRGDGRLTVAAAGRLLLLGFDGVLDPFAQGPGGYSTALGTEPYIALATGQDLPQAGCSFHPDDVYALEPAGTPGVIRIDPQGGAQRIADLAGVEPNGITFDGVGRFGHELLVTAATHGVTAVFAVDCAGRVTTIAPAAPRVEGGIAVAGPSFGAFGGDLIAADEQSGRIVAVAPTGQAQTVADSHLPTGGDIGVESVGVVPAGLGPGVAAYVSDRRTPGNPHPGTDTILELSGAELVAAGVRPGDILVASEGGAQTVAVSCAATCAVRHVADGPQVSHVEGHLIFAPASG